MTGHQSLYEVMSEQSRDKPLYESEAAMGWPYWLFAAFAVVVIGSAVAFVFNNWPLITVAAADFWRAI
jgi:hypothetical protein